MRVMCEARLGCKPRLVSSEPDSSVVCANVCGVYRSPPYASHFSIFTIVPNRSNLCTFLQFFPQMSAPQGRHLYFDAKQRKKHIEWLNFHRSTHRSIGPVRPRLTMSFPASLGISECSSYSPPIQS